MYLKDFKTSLGAIYKSKDDYNEQNSKRFPLNLRYMKLGFKLEDYQVPAAYAVSRFNDIWYTDAPGMGKTPTTIAAMSDMYGNGKRKFLVIALASILGQWKDSLLKFSTFETVLVRGTKQQRDKAYYEFSLGKSDVLLISYNTFVTDAQVFKKFKFDCLICDESDYIKSIESQAYREIFNLTYTIPSIKLLTGTPFTGKLEDSFYALTLLSHRKISYYSMLANFCEMKKIEVPIYDKITGVKRTIKHQVIAKYKNLDKFKDLTDGFIFGRSLEETGAKLPGIKEEIVWVQPSAKLLAYQKLTLAGKFIQPDGHKITLNSLQKVSYLHRGTHALQMLYPESKIINPKKNALLSLINDLGDEQVAIFCNYKRVPEEIYDILEEKGGCSRCDGGITGQSRLNSIEDFKSGKNQYLVFTMAGYGGIDLYNCRHLIIYDFVYNRAKFDQIKGRVIRKSSIHPLSTIYYIFCNNSIDCAIWNLLQNRKNLMDFFETEEDTSKEILAELSKVGTVGLNQLG